MKRLYSYLLSIAVVWMLCLCTHAQTAQPTISFYSIDEEADITMTEGESNTCQAPLDITCTANVEALEGYTHQCEWKIFNTNVGETSPILTRFEENTSYTMIEAGSYGIKLYVSFFKQDADTLIYESDIFTITISESSLTCPNAFSPNGDGINDVFNIQYQSIVKFEAMIFNRWGQKLHTMNLGNIDEGWDGRSGGKYVKDGVYFININAVGSDGVEYKIKKAINVLKGFRDEGGIDNGQ